MNTRVATLVAVAGFVVRFLRLGTIENDHYVYLARAHQMLHGDWPVRDFVDAGFPLGYLLSAGAAAIAGPTLLTEAVVAICLFSIALAVTFALTRRASGSTVIAVVAVVIVLLLPPRLYNSSKMLVPIVGIAIAWTYCDRPNRLRAIALGAWAAVGFLFRHDYGLYLGVVTMVMLLQQHRGDWRLIAERAVTIVLAAVVVASPWLIYVQVQQGLPDYFAAAMRFSLAEGNRTVSRWAPIYYVIALVPVAALIVAWRGSHQLSRAQATFATLLVLISDLVLLRDAPASRLPDVYATTAVAAAVVFGSLKPATTRAIRGRVVAIAALAVIAFAGVGAAAGRWQLVARRLHDARPAVMPDPARAPLIEYIRRCTATDERVLVGGFGPELPVLAQRPFAAGLPDWLRGYYDDPADVGRARAQLAREQVAVAVMLDGGDAFNASWPSLAADLRARGLAPHDLQLASGHVELWVKPMESLDALTGLPCETTR